MKRKKVPPTRDWRRARDGPTFPTTGFALNAAPPRAILIWSRCRGEIAADGFMASSLACTVNVVPAKAGTHDPAFAILPGCCASLRKICICGYGPCFRRDDIVT